MTEELITVRAAELQVGDFLLGSKQTVNRAASRGLRTPSGKVDLGVVSRNGRERRVTWNARTTMRISRRLAELCPGCETERLSHPADDLCRSCEADREVPLTELNDPRDFAD